MFTDPPFHMLTCALSTVPRVHGAELCGICLRIYIMISEVGTYL